MKIENAKIGSTTFGVEDHGILTFWVVLEGDGWGQGLGGYALDQWNEKLKTRVGMGSGLEAMHRIMSTVGASTWESLPGKLCRVKRNHPDDKPIIGHIIDEKWFDLKQFMEQARDQRDQ